MRRRQGRVEEAARLLDRAGSSGSAQLCGARLALDRDETRRAVELVERLLRRIPPESKLERVPALELLVRSRVASGDLAGAQRAFESLRDIEELVATKPLRAATDLVEGVLEAAGGDVERARILLEGAADRFQQIGAPFDAALAQIELATTLIALGRTELAMKEATQARDRLLDLGAEAEAERARRLIEHRAGSRADSFPGITQRERDVLELVAEGLTNRQIAERLVVSEHTIHRHVTNILRKLDLPSRTAAAAYAVRSGLLDE